MKKLFTLLAVAVLATSAQAGDFDKTNMNLTMDSERYGFSLSRGATTDFNDDAKVIDVYAKTKIVDAGVIFVRNNNAKDYRLYVTKRTEVPFGKVMAYVKPEINYSFGDSYTKNELRISPALGAEYAMGKLTPFVEAGYTFKAVDGDLLNHSKDSSYNKVGVGYDFDKQYNVSISITDERDANFKKLDREAGVKLTIKF